jgi:hypothetical protein
MNDVAARLELVHRDNGDDDNRQYTGFDISASHFPSDNPGLGMRYVVHDILEPFPEEFHGSHDMVHIRLLVLALKKDDIKTAATNVAALLSEFFTPVFSFKPIS